MKTNTPSETPQKTPPHPKRKFILGLMALVFVALAIACWVYWLGWGRYIQSTEDAFVSGNIVQLMPQVSGTVSAIYADETQAVVAGQTLVRLNDADLQIALQKAVAAMAQTLRQVKQYYEDVAQAKAELALRQNERDKAQADFQRRLGLLKTHAISREEFQHVKVALTAAKGQYELAQHRLAAALALVENSHLYQHPLVLQAATLVRSAYLNLQRAAIQSPINGFVAKRAVQLGQQVMPGTPLLTIVPLDQVWVEANFKESQLANMRLGQQVTLVVDAYKHLGTYHGWVQGFNPGTGSTFALLPPQNATGNWIKIVQRLPVRITLDPKEIKRHPLQIGLSVQVRVHTGQKLGAAPPRPISTAYTTAVFDPQLAAADKLIADTLRANAPNDVVVEAVSSEGKL